MSVEFSSCIDTERLGNFIRRGRGLVVVVSANGKLAGKEPNVWAPWLKQARRSVTRSVTSDGLAEVLSGLNGGSDKVRLKKKS